MGVVVGLGSRVTTDQYSTWRSRRGSFMGLVIVKRFGGKGLWVWDLLLVLRSERYGYLGEYSTRLWSLADGASSTAA